MITVPIWLFSVVIAFVAGGIVDHFIGKKVQDALDAERVRLAAAAKDLKG